MEGHDSTRDARTVLASVRRAARSVLDLAGAFAPPHGMHGPTGGARRTDPDSGEVYEHPHPPPPDPLTDEDLAALAAWSCDPLLCKVVAVLQRRRAVLVEYAKEGIMPLPERGMP